MSFITQLLLPYNCNGYNIIIQVCVCGVDGEYWVCPCQRWLCLDSGDGRIERKLHPLISQEPAKVDSTWTVHVWTSDIRGAGTDANVSIQVSQSSMT